MSDVSAKWWELMGKRHITETSVIIDGATYYDSDIVSMRTTGALFQNGPTVGNCISGKISLEIVYPDAMPVKMARIEPFVRLRAGDDVSEWVPKGKYYIDTRKANVGQGSRDAAYSTYTLSIEGYDAMQALDNTFSASDALWWLGAYNGQITNSRRDIDVVRRIVSKLGVTLDSDVPAVMTRDFWVYFPGTDESAYTMREVLGQIGAMYAGNWYFTDDGKLRLLLLGAEGGGEVMGTESNEIIVDSEGNALLFSGGGIVDPDGDYTVNVAATAEEIEVGRVREPFAWCFVNQDDFDYTDGDMRNSGVDKSAVLEIKCPLIELDPTVTQMQALNIVMAAMTDADLQYLSALSVAEVRDAAARILVKQHVNSVIMGYSYQPYRLKNAFISPSTELGYAITAGSLYGVIAQSKIDFDRNYTADIEAPGSRDLEHEYKGNGALTAMSRSATYRAINRKIAASRWVGTQAEYDALPEKSDDVVYYIKAES